MEHVNTLKEMVGLIEVEVGKLTKKNRIASALRIRQYIKVINQTTKALRMETLSSEKDIKKNNQESKKTIREDDTNFD